MTPDELAKLHDYPCACCSHPPTEFDIWFHTHHRRIDGRWQVIRPDMPHGFEQVKTLAQLVELAVRP